LKPYDIWTAFAAGQKAALQHCSMSDTSLVSSDCQELGYSKICGMIQVGQIAARNHMTKKPWYTQLQSAISLGSVTKLYDAQLCIALPTGNTPRMS